MKRAPTVFLDSNVMKFSGTAEPRLRPRREVIDWGDKKMEWIVHDFIYYNPNTRIRNSPELRKEADLLEEVAGFVKEGKLEAVMQMEAEFEWWGRAIVPGGVRFYGAPIKYVDAPIKYGRLLMGAGLDAGELQLSFLTGIREPRFLELQRVTGGFQGVGRAC